MPSLLVTVGTDGSKDWVKTPDGQKFALGPVSVMTLVTKLTRTTKVAREVLDEFLKKGEALLSVDQDRLWALLAPRPARWAAGPFMPAHPRRLGMAETWKADRREAGSFNAKPRLAFDEYAANMSTAREILAKARQTVGTIDRLCASGKRFNASRARADVAYVTTKVASICSQTELTESWVREDLAKLASRNDSIHALFHPRAAAKTPKSKFKEGDRVQVMDDGEELYVGKVRRAEYDSYAETWKYKIEIEGRGKTLTFNEKSLEKR